MIYAVTDVDGNLGAIKGETNSIIAFGTDCIISDGFGAY